MLFLVLEKTREPFFLTLAKYPLLYEMQHPPRAHVLRLELEVQIKEEIQKLLDVGFIKPIQHPTWFANILPVKKKNGLIRCCIDFRDLNKACPKNEFPLSNIDMLVDVTAEYSMSLSWMVLADTTRSEWTPKTLRRPHSELP